MWESPVPEFEGLDMSQLGTDEAFLRVQQSGEQREAPSSPLT